MAATRSRGAGAPGALGLGVFATAACVLCWLAFEDTGFRDSGELGAAAHVLGVAHPTGFAVDLLLLRAFEWLPFGPLAFRQNLAMALQAALALALLATLCDRISRMLGVRAQAQRWAGAMLAVCAVGTFRTFLETAIAVEVYSLSLCAVLFAANAALRERRSAGVCCAVLGFSPGMHVTVGLFGAVVLAAVCVKRRKPLRFLAARIPGMAAGVLCVSYLPLAARRGPALNWGDPHSLVRVIDHLTAARIRSAYQSEMWAGSARAATELLDQLAPLAWLLPCVLLAFVLGRRRRFVLLLPLALLACDLVYALRVNPMGIADRQVGHLGAAMLALLGGVGVALGGGGLVGRMPKLATSATVLPVALAGTLLFRVPASVVADGYAASELYGSGGALGDVPPRSLLLCWTDDSCAVGLFARYAEQLRPDTDILPGQHLWDPWVRRRSGVPQLARLGPSEPAPAARARSNAAALRALATPGLARPLLFEGDVPLVAGTSARALASAHPPWLQLSAAAAREPELQTVVAQLDRRRRQRFPAGRARSERAQTAWSQSYDAVASTALGTWAAVAAERTSVQLAPERAVGWNNLGVALDRVGHTREAIVHTLRAIELDPQRVTPWLNLLRMQLLLGERTAARETLAAARLSGVSDARLRELSAALDRRPR